MSSASLVLAAIAGVMLIGFLLLRPKLTPAVKLWLAFAVAVLPFGASVSGNVAGWERSKERSFCASCHVMEPHATDAADQTSKSLASFHSRNGEFGDESCYRCHRDYGMFGSVTTKLTGMKHLWRYYTRDASDPIQLYKPYPNSNCIQCHSTTLPGFKDEPEHSAVMDDIKSGATSCTTAGCHGPVHPKGAKK